MPIATVLIELWAWSAAAKAAAEEELANLQADVPGTPRTSAAVLFALAAGLRLPVR